MVVYLITETVATSLSLYHLKRMTELTLLTSSAMSEITKSRRL